MLRAAVVFLFAFVFAQQPAAKPDQLTTTERLALQSVNEQFKMASDNLHAVEKEIAANHPGYQLDEATLQLAPIQKPTPTPSK